MYELQFLREVFFFLGGGVFYGVFFFKLNQFEFKTFSLREENK